jgi:hypothetical protein
MRMTKASPADDDSLGEHNRAKFKIMMSSRPAIRAGCIVAFSLTAAVAVILRLN